MPGNPRVCLHVFNVFYITELKLPICNLVLLLKPPFGCCFWNTWLLPWGRVCIRQVCLGSQLLELRGCDYVQGLCSSRRAQPKRSFLWDCTRAGRRAPPSLSLRSTHLQEVLWAAQETIPAVCYPCALSVFFLMQYFNALRISCYVFFIIFAPYPTLSPISTLTLHLPFLVLLLHLYI